MQALQPGATLHNGKYTIIQILGQGSFGITYLATTKIMMQGSIGRMEMEVKVAIKEFYMSDLNSRSADGNTLEKTDSLLVKKYARKFHTEAENLSKLHHPNIVKVLEVFDENNTSYYVMEYIEGETLDNYIKRNGRIGEAEARLIALDICSALRHMHDNHMLHLDLKPKNVMRDHNGKYTLIDFGLAKQYNENGEPESSTSLGLGTRGYAPVEQMKYKSDGTMPATLDIYALGATIFKMLTGKVPPESSDVLNEGLPVRLLQEAGVSQNMIAIVEKAMAPLKRNRYQQVGELVDALTTNVGPATEAMAEQHSEETAVEHEGPKVETPPYTPVTPPPYNPVTPPPYNPVSPPPYNQETPPVYYDEEEPSFLQKYWKYGVAALLLLLILGGVLLFSGSKDKNDEEAREQDLIATDKNHDGDEKTGEAADTAGNTENTDETALKEAKDQAPKAAEDAKKTAKKAAEDAPKEAKKAAEDVKKAAEDAKKPVEKEKKAVEDNNIYDVAEQMPQFTGGDLISWIRSHINYPPAARENGTHGTVIVKVVIEKNGSISNVTVTRGKDPSLDKEAVRVVKSMPRWKPGKNKGNPVRVYYTIPVPFTL